MPKANPCPFCGGTPEFENTDERARLRCTGCGTEGGLFFFSQEECESGIGDATEARAIEAWNRRTPAGVAPSAATDRAAVGDCDFPSCAVHHICTRKCSRKERNAVGSAAPNGGVHEHGCGVHAIPPRACDCVHAPGVDLLGGQDG